MLPIVQFPRIVEQQASWFEPVFTTDEQRKHFREYVTGLIAGDKVTVTAINNLFLGEAATTLRQNLSTLPTPFCAWKRGRQDDVLGSGAGRDRESDA